jgi:hypothetical protein
VIFAVEGSAIHHRHHHLPLAHLLLLLGAQAGYVKKPFCPSARVLRSVLPPKITREKQTNQNHPQIQKPGTAPSSLRPSKKVK